MLDSYFPGTIWEGWSPTRVDANTYREPDASDWRQVVAEMFQVQRMLIAHDLYIKSGLKVKSQLSLTHSTACVHTQTKSLQPTTLAMTSVAVVALRLVRGLTNTLVFGQLTLGVRVRSFTMKLATVDSRLSRLK